MQRGELCNLRIGTVSREDCSFSSRLFKDKQYQGNALPKAQTMLIFDELLNKSRGS
jgi:hypothetical protein